MRKDPATAIREIARRLEALDIEALSFDHDLAKQHRSALFDIAQKATSVALAIKTAPERKTDRTTCYVQNRSEAETLARLGGLRALAQASEPRTIKVTSEVTEIPLAKIKIG
jgi:hypothetical protein